MKMFLLITLLAGFSFSQEHAHEGCGGHEAEPAGVELKTAAGGPVERQFTFPAEIKVNRNRFAAVSPRYAGVIRELRVAFGDAVKQGDVLAVMENRETLALYPLVSPLDGAVVSVNGSAGESADEAAVLFEIADLSSVWVEIHVFPQYQQAVRKGMSVRLTAPDGSTAETMIDYVSPLVSPETRTALARGVLSGAGLGFAPGTFVSARLTVESVNAEVRVEKEAVQTVGGETVVFVKDADGIEPRDVQTGLSDGTFVEIKSGLKPGEPYVAHGAFEFKAELLTSGINPHAGCGH
jgi:cobalt-zinc-cadmium efflux system membrane fusion protein